MDAATFAPDQTVTREQLAVFLYNYAKRTGAKVDGLPQFGFTDAASISAWAKEALYWCSTNKLVNGLGDGTVAPQGTATRAQAAVMFMGVDLL